MVNAADFAGVFDSGIGDIAVIGGVQVPGNFQQEFVLVDDVESQVPVFICYSAAVRSLSNGDAVQVAGESYRVKSIRPGSSRVFTRLVLDYAA